MFTLISILLPKEMSLKEQEVLKTVGNFAGRNTLRSSVEYGLTLSDHKRRNLSQWWWKRRVSKSLVFFQEMRLFKIPVNHPFCKYQKIYCFSNLLYHEDHMSTEMCGKNSFKKMLWLKIMILHFFSQKYIWLPKYDKTMQSYSLPTGKITPIKSFQLHLMFLNYPQNANKNVAFLNVLSALVVSI